MSTNVDTLVLGAGPGALAIAAALCNEKVHVGILSSNEPREIWPYTYGIWGEEVDSLGLQSLLKHRWVFLVKALRTNPPKKISLPNIL